MSAGASYRAHDRIGPRSATCFRQASRKCSGESLSFDAVSYTLGSPVSAKHKFATRDLAPGDPILMYGVIVGKALYERRFTVAEAQAALAGSAQAPAA